MAIDDWRRRLLSQALSATRYLGPEFPWQLMWFAPDRAHVGEGAKFQRARRSVETPDRGRALLLQTTGDLNLVKAGRRRRRCLGSRDPWQRSKGEQDSGDQPAPEPD